MHSLFKEERYPEPKLGPGTAERKAEDAGLASVFNRKVPNFLKLVNNFFWTLGNFQSVQRPVLPAVRQPHPDRGGEEGGAGQAHIGPGVARSRAGGQGAGRYCQKKEVL